MSFASRIAARPQASPSERAPSRKKGLASRSVSAEISGQSESAAKLALPGPAHMSRRLAGEKEGTSSRVALNAAPVAAKVAGMRAEQ